VLAFESLTSSEILKDEILLGERRQFALLYQVVVRWSEQSLACED
jgi:hypothetical protein